MSLKDMPDQGSDTEDADYDIEESLEELEAKQDLGFLKEQIDNLAREIEAYPDSCCMFRAVAVCCDTELQSCTRFLGWPSVSSLVVKYM